MTLDVQPAASAGFPFDNSYARLPERFHARLAPATVKAPRLVKLNAGLAAELGIDLAGLDDASIAQLFAGNRPPEGAEPLAMAYAGHQFGHFVPQLGDGRALLLGEVIDRDGRRRDIQLKGSGKTPFSRMGDGKAALGPVLREYLVSEAMHALGIPTTRALAAVLTGEPVYREDLLPGAVLTRVAASHVRVGTFQYFAARRDDEAVRHLADYVIDRLYPALKTAEQPYLALLETVVERQAALVARWLQVGFIHGVMNTDNMAISGETIDFGPCAFMDEYDPATWFSSVDEAGRYAYANQPAIAQWNLARLAEAMLPLLDQETEKAVDAANVVIGSFEGRFGAHWLDGMRRKLGLGSEEEGDRELVTTLLDAMQSGGADFTLTFRRLAAAAAAPSELSSVRALFGETEAFDRWAASWRERLARDSLSAEARAALMRAANPAFIPRNHQVEAALAAAVEKDDLAPFERLLAVLARPYDDQPDAAAFALPAPPSDRPYRTFCGT